MRVNVRFYFTHTIGRYLIILLYIVTYRYLHRCNADREPKIIRMWRQRVYTFESFGVFETIRHTK